MNEMITIYINDKPVSVKDGTVLAAALAQAGLSDVHHSPSGHNRGPLCAMGTCFECTVTVNGVPHRRSCQTLCTSGMKVQTSE